MKLQVEKEYLEKIIIKHNNMEKEIENLRKKFEKSETIETKPDNKEENDNADENYQCDFYLMVAQKTSKGLNIKIKLQREEPKVVLKTSWG